MFHTPHVLQVLLTSGFEGRAYVPAAVLIYYFAVVCTAGLLWLVMQWYPKARSKLVSRSVSHIAADFFIVTGVDGSVEICPVEPIAAVPLELQNRGCWQPGFLNTARAVPLGQRMVVYRHSRFNWSEPSQSFQLQTPEDFPPAPTLAGLSEAEAADRYQRAGTAAIDVPIPSGWTLFFREAIHPFFVFQIWCVAWQ